MLVMSRRMGEKLRRRRRKRRERERGRIRMIKGRRRRGEETEKEQEDRSTWPAMPLPCICCMFIASIVVLSCWHLPHRLLEA
jgi:hypothetical protein